MTFLNLVKFVQDAFEDKCQIWTRFSEVKLWLADLNHLHDLHNTSAPGYYEDEKNTMLEREYSKTMKNH